MNNLQHAVENFLFVVCLAMSLQPSKYNHSGFVSRGFLQVFGRVYDFKRGCNTSSPFRESIIASL